MSNKTFAEKLADLIDEELDLAHDPIDKMDKIISVMEMYLISLREEER